MFFVRLPIKARVGLSLQNKKQDVNENNLPNLPSNLGGISFGVLHTLATPTNTSRNVKEGRYEDEIGNIKVTDAIKKGPKAFAFHAWEPSLLRRLSFIPGDGPATVFLRALSL